MKISELQQKNMIDMNSGKIIGRIVDMEINKEDGSLLNFIVEKAKFKSLFSSEEDILVEFKQIKKIGEDVILVDLT